MYVFLWINLFIIYLYDVTTSLPINGRPLTAKTIYETAQVMKSTKAWAESEHDFIRRAGAWSPTRKMIRLPGDWALINDNETRAAVGLFANDESKFFEVFGQAFTKVLGKGQPNLKTCGEMWVLQ